jgi:hypothetical protein
VRLPIASFAPTNGDFSSSPPISRSIGLTLLIPSLPGVPEGATTIPAVWTQKFANQIQKVNDSLRESLASTSFGKHNQVSSACAASLDEEETMPSELVDMFVWRDALAKGRDHTINHGLCACDFCHMCTEITLLFGFVSIIRYSISFIFIII